MEIEIITPNVEIKPEVPEVEVEVGGSVVKDDYEKLKNLPSINGKELIGDLSTEDLGIEAGSDIELITELKPESIEEDLKPNQVYNGNAIHDLARLFGMTLQDLTKTLPQIITEFDLYAEYKENDVYNAIAVNQLMEIFGFEIMQIMEFVEDHEERISALEG